MKALLLILTLALSFSSYGQRVAWKPLDKEGRLGHGSMVYSAVFSADSKYLASYDQAGTIVVWDLASGKVRYRIDDTDSERFEEPVFSPDGKLLAAIVGRHDEPTELLDSTIRFWNASTGKVVGSLDGSFRHIEDLTFSPDSTTLYAAIDMKSTGVWDAATLKAKPPMLSVIGPYDFNNAGTQIAAATEDRKAVIILDVRTGMKVRTIPGFDFVASVAFDPTERFLAINDEESGEKGMRLKMWNLATGRRVLGFDTVDQHPSVAFTSNGKSAVLVQFEKNSADTLEGFTRIGAFYDPATGKKQKDLKVNFPFNGFGTTFSPDGRFLAVRSSSSVTNTVPESDIRIIDIIAGTQKASLSGYRRAVTSMAFSTDGRELISAHPDGRLIAWDTTTWSPTGSLLFESTDSDANLKLLPGLRLFTPGEVSHTHSVATGEPVQDSTDEKFFKTYQAVSGDGQLMLAADDERFWFYILPGHDLRNSFPTPLKSGAWANVSIALDKAGEKLAIGYDTGINILDTKTGKELSRFPLPKGIIGNITFSSDGKYVGAANSESAATDRRWTISVLDTDSGKTVFSSRTDESAYAFSPDNSTIATLGGSDRLLITRLADGRQVSESKVPVRKLSGPVYFTFHPSRRLLAAGSEYGIQIFDTATGVQVARIK